MNLLTVITSLHIILNMLLLFGNLIIFSMFGPWLFVLFVIWVKISSGVSDVNEGSACLMVSVRSIESLSVSFGDIFIVASLVLLFIMLSMCFGVSVRAMKALEIGIRAVSGGFMLWDGLQRNSSSVSLVGRGVFLSCATR